MSFQPVLPPPLLGALALVIVVARVVVLGRLRAAGPTRAALWRWCGVTVAALMLIVAAARPVIGSDDQAATRVAGDRDPNVFVVVDRSPDMGVQDVDGRTRMAVARDDIGALIDRYPHARFAVIAFATNPTLQWPLSADAWSLRPAVATVSPYAASPDSLTRTDVGAAATVLRYQLISAVQQYPRARNLVYYLGAGAAESELPARKFELPEGSVGGGAVLGYGTAAGGPIPGTDVERSSVGDAALRAVAAQLGVSYVPRADASPPAEALPGDGTTIGQTPPALRAGDRIETYWAPATVAAVLILIELYLVLRDFRRTRLATVDVT
jgi:Ca-activated chloride channel family protein